ncbi:MAG: TIGR01777 family oxidoreductase, partial [Bacteroidota bacterium]
FLRQGHQVWTLARHAPKRPMPPGAEFLEWDGRTAGGWAKVINEVEVVLNVAGKSLASWPWTAATRREFRESRVHAGQAITQAIAQAAHRPRVLVQSSGINYYGLSGETAEESTPPAGDFLARLTVDWETSTRPVEDMGLRRVITRSAVVLARGGGLLPLMALPIRLFAGGRLGRGKQAMPWIHIEDEIEAIHFLIDRADARGPFNLIAPQPTSSDSFMRRLAKALKRPYWFPAPAFLLRLILGRMSVLITDGRYSRPMRLLELGYNFRFPTIEEALSDLYAR